MRKEEFTQKIKVLLKNKEISDDEQLAQLLKGALMELSGVKQKREIIRVAAQLSQSLSLYLMTHQYKAPADVISFSMWLAKAPSQERGAIATLQMLAFSLANLGK